MTAVKKVTVRRATDADAAYADAVRNLSLDAQEALQRNPAPQPGDGPVIAHAKALWRELASERGVTYEGDAIFGHRV